jgi:hypothetical protein
MTQKIFDTDNAEDMALLWSILPKDYYRIEKRGKVYCFYKSYAIDHYETFADFFKIDWHDKTEITRPIQEATEADIGKICYFWDKEKSGCYAYGELLPRGINSYIDFPYEARNGRAWKHCRRLTKQEIEELC